MNAWTVFTVAFAAVVLQAWISRRGEPHWYMGCIVPLIYGGVVAWMFRGEDLLLSLQIILFGSVIPIGLLLSLRGKGKKDQGEDDSPSET